MNLSYDLPPNVQFRLASTQSEFEQAFRLLHDAYVNVGLMVPHESKMRISIYNALLTSYVLVIVINDEVVGTVSLIRDSKLGLPSEKILDMNHLRKTGVQMGEVSALAIKPEWRNKLFLHLTKFLYEFATKSIGVNFFVISAHSDWYMFYETILFFKKIEDRVITNYSSANFVPVVGEYLDLRTFPQNAHQTYSKRPRNKNIFEFFFKNKNPQFQVPQNEYYSIINTNMSSRLIRYFCKERFNLTSGMNEKEYFSLKAFFKDLDIPDVLPPPDHLTNVSELSFDRNWRMPTYIRAHSIGIPSMNILNVSRTGFQALAGEHTWQSGQTCEVTLCVGPKKEATVKAEVRWVDKERAGFYITSAGVEWDHYINFCQSQMDKIKGEETQTSQSGRTNIYPLRRTS